MKNEARFEDMIRKVLKDEALKIAATEDSLNKVRERIKKDGYSTQTGGTRGRMPHQKLSDYLYFLNRYKPAIVLFCFVLLISLVFVYNEPARVMAKKGVKKLVTMVYVVVKGEDGKYDTVQVPMDLSNNQSDYSCEPTYLSDDELSKEAGFNVKTPENLADGYILWETYRYKTKDTSKKTVKVDKSYYRGSEKLYLQISTDKEILKSKTAYEDHKGEFKVADTNVGYIELHVPEYPVVKENGTYKSNSSQKPTKINTYNVMEWEFNGVYYRLSDGWGTSVSQAEFNEVINALIKGSKE